MSKYTRKVVLSGLMISLVCIATMSIQIPTPGDGYVNIGDSVIFISSIMFGPVIGMTAGGIGSLMADILSGYTHWAIFSLLIKGFEGYIVGVIVGKINNNIFKNISATLVGTLVMVLGYLVAGTLLKGSFLISLSAVVPNIIQGSLSIIIAIPFSYSLRNMNSIKSFNG